MNARKLPSGNYNVQIYDYTDHSGKQHYKSFTAKTKREAERRALEYASNNKAAVDDPTVEDALSLYISSKEAVLSPSTIRNYLYISRRYFGRIEARRIHSLTQLDLQRFVSDLTHEVSPKTVKNVYGLFTAAVKIFDRSIDLTVTMPRQPKRRPKSPTDQEVQELVRKASKWLRVCIALAAFGSLRRGEICAIQRRDIRGNSIHVHACRVKNKNHEWIVKETPKTSDSDRIVALPPAVIQMCGKGAPDDFIVEQCPDTVTKEFIKLRDEIGLSIRFHDLRHYFASIGVALGVPDVYLAGMGGWSQNSSAMKEIYQNKIVTMEEVYNQKMANHFDELLQKKANHE